MSYHDKLYMEIFFFGNFRIKIGGQELNLEEWKSHKALTLLQYFLYSNGKRLSKDFLLEFLWPEDNKSLHNLHVAIYYIRNYLRKYSKKSNEKFVYYDKGYYNFSDNVVKSIDCLKFEELYHNGIELEEYNPEDALRKYKDALDIYQGSFLINDIYQDWTSNIRQNYLNLLTDIMVKSAKILYNSKDYREAIKICKKALKYPIYDEDLYYILIKLLIKTGNSMEATKYYQDYSKYVYEEYDIEVNNRFHELFIDSNLSIQNDNKIQHNSCGGPFLCNRNLFELLYNLAVKRQNRYDECFSLIYLEIRGKLIEEVKQYLIHICRKRLREGDIICHWDNKSILLKIYRVNGEECSSIRERVLNGVSQNIKSKISMKTIMVNGENKPEYPILERMINS